MHCKIQRGENNSRSRCIFQEYLTGIVQEYDAFFKYTSLANFGHKEKLAMCY